jgi:large subunit ribosomal protein L25
MARPKLKVQKRKLFGRKVKKLRLMGILPANIYGKKIKSQALSLALKEFSPVYKEVGETGLIDLLIEKEKTPHPVLVHNLQLHPVTDQPVHVDFHQVSLTEKVKAEIPIQLAGESPASEQKIGILVRLLDQLEVEALPTDFPEKIEVNVSSLEKVGDMIKVKDIAGALKKVTIVTDPKRLVVKIEPPTKVEEKAPVAEVPAEGEEVPAEGEEVPAEGEAPAKPTEGTPESKGPAEEKGKKEEAPQKGAKPKS